MKDTDIVVVGGGPAGLISARTAAERGKDIVLFESKEHIGTHEHCAGLLSIDGLKQLNLEKIPSEVIQNSEIKGAKIYSPLGRTITVSKKTPTAVVVNRALFNKFLLQRAEESEVSIKTSSRVLRLEREKESIKLKLGKKSDVKDIKCKITILAEGRFPKLNNQVGIPSPSKDAIVFSSMYIMDNIKDIESEYVELYQDQKYSPGFFAWIIPINDNSAKVGLASSSVPASDYLNSFIKNNSLVKHKLKKARIVKKMSGAIPLGSYINKTYCDNILVVGDAAGQTKPTTGGGVIFGGIAARIAGDVASKAIDSETYNSKFLSEYQKRWSKEFKSNLKVMKLTRSYINSLSSQDLDRFFKILNRDSLKNKISQLGDIDNQKEIVSSLLKSPRLWPILILTGTKFLIKK